MSRWVRSICEALRHLESLAVEGLVRIWAHEALRLFQVCLRFGCCILYRMFEFVLILTKRRLSTCENYVHLNLAGSFGS